MKPKVQSLTGACVRKKEPSLEYRYNIIKIRRYNITYNNLCYNVVDGIVTHYNLDTGILESNISHNACLIDPHNVFNYSYGTILDEGLSWLTF